MQIASKVRHDYILKQKTSFSKCPQLLWVIFGNGTIQLGSQKLNFQNEDLLFIPNHCSYCIECDTPCTIIKIYIDQLPGFGNLIYNINNKLNKISVSNFLMEYELKPNFDIVSSSSKLVKTILSNTNGEPSITKTVNDERILKAVNYIENNFTSRFSINDIAKLLHINQAYLSTYFKQEIGISIVKYTYQLRLEAAIDQIVETTKSITQIAFETGFADVRTLNSMIKERYLFTPIKLRKLSNQTLKLSNTSSSARDLIHKYANVDIDADTIKLNVNINMNAPITKVTNKLHTFAIGRAHDILYRNVSEQIIQAKKDLDFKYCRFHNIFGDEMHIFDIGYGNDFNINLSMPFRVIDFLLAQDILPIIELGFFPKEIANSTLSPFTGYKANVQGDINFQLWEQLISTFAQELYDRYPDKYHLFYYDFFNEPDVNMFWGNSHEDFVQLYKITYHAFKKISSNFKIGGFGFGNFSESTQLIEAIIEATYTSGCQLDFLSIHSYPFIAEINADYIDTMTKTNTNVTYVEGKLEIDIKRAKKIKERFKIEEIFISEWNTSPFQREGLNDSIYKSSKIIEHYTNSIDNPLNGICYWALSDEMCEFGYGVKEVHGGFGLITRSGLKKPAYHAVEMVSKLSGNLIHNQDGITVFEQNQRYIFLINNSLTYSRSYSKDINGEHATSNVGCKIDLKLTSSNMATGRYFLDYQKITNDLSLDFILERNNLQKDYLLPHEISQIEQFTNLNTTRTIIDIDDKFSLSINVEPGESHMAILTPM